MRPPVSKPGNPKPLVSEISPGQISPHFTDYQRSIHGVRQIRVVPIIPMAREFDFRGLGSTVGYPVVCRLSVAWERPV